MEIHISNIGDSLEGKNRLLTSHGQLESSQQWLPAYRVRTGGNASSTRAWQRTRPPPSDWLKQSWRGYSLRGWPLCSS